MPEHSTQRADEHVAEQAEQQEEEAPPPISFRALILLGGVSSVAAVAVLALTLVIGPGAHGGLSDPARSPVPGSRVDGAQVEVPDVAGLAVMEAVNRLAVQRIPLGGVIRVPSSRDAGQVVRSYPQGGTVLRGGAPVTLYVSAGVGGSVASAEVTVPYLVGLDSQRARGTLAGLGLRAQLANSGTAVAGQQPAPGSVLPRGSVVALTLR